MTTLHYNKIVLQSIFVGFVIIAVCISVLYYLNILKVQLLQSYQRSHFNIRVQQKLPVNYIYTNQTGSVKGKQFHISQHRIQQYTHLLTDFVHPTREIFERFIFVTGVSSNHFLQSQSAIGSIQMHFGNKTIHYYDWGLTDTELKQVKRWCNVKLKPFNFEAFPHLAELAITNPSRYQAAKVFALAESLKESPAVFWVDASVRFITGNLTKMYSLAVKNKGIAVFRGSYISTFAITPPGMYDYLPTKINGMKNTMQIGTS